MSDEKPEPVREEEKTVQPRAYVRKTKMYAKKCERCGTPFEGTARAKFCSPACRVMAWEDAHPENRRARQKRYQQANPRSGKKPPAAGG